MESTTPQRPTRRSTPLFAVVALTSLLGATACSSTNSGERATAASESMESFNFTTMKARDVVDATITSLETLMASSGDEIKPAFTAFRKDLVQLEQRAQSVREQAAAMKLRGDKYFAGWDADTSKISAGRNAELAKSYATIKEDMAAAKSNFEPFMATLKDIEAYLNLDLTSQGMAVAKPMAKAAGEQGRNVMNEIEQVLRQVNSVRGMISPTMER